MNFDHQKLIEALEFMKEHQELPISEIKGSLRDKYLYLQNYIKTVDDDFFEEQIDSTFSEIKEYIPGTIGAYFNGYNDICNHLCAGSIYCLKKHKDKPHADHLFMYTLWNGKRFIFIDLNDSFVRITTTIYTQFKTLEEFPGISENEKAHLVKYGIQNINLISYTQSIELFKGQIADIKVRN